MSGLIAHAAFFSAMVWHKPDLNRPVRVIQISGGLVISGAYLNAEEAWIPDVECLTVIDGSTFIRISKSSRSLQRFCGKNLAGNVFLDDFANERNNACETIRKEISPGKSLKRTFRGPRTVDVVVQSVTSQPALSITCMFDLIRGNNVWMECNVRNLEFVASNTNACHGGGVKYRKRSLETKMDFPGYPHVGWNYQRGSAYITYQDADNRWHKHFCKADCNDADAVREVCDALMRYRLDHHYEGGAVGPDDEIEASEPDLDAPNVEASDVSNGDRGNDDREEVCGDHSGDSANS